MAVSIAYTLDAPCFNKQSVKPPTDEPISAHVFPFGEIENLFNAASNFIPPRLTYGKFFFN